MRGRDPVVHDMIFFHLRFECIFFKKTKTTQHNNNTSLNDLQCLGWLVLFSRCSCDVITWNWSRWFWAREKWIALEHASGTFRLWFGFKNYCFTEAIQLCNSCLLHLKIILQGLSVLSTLILDINNFNILTVFLCMYNDWLTVACFWI